MADLEAALRKRYLPRPFKEDLFLCPNAADVKFTRDARPEVRAELWNTKRLGAARAVIIDDSSRTRAQLPPVLGSSPPLEFLQVPQHLAAQLREVHVRNLRGELRIRGEGPADLLEIGLAKGVTHLGGYKITTRFNGASFPALRGLSIWEKNRKHLLNLFAALPKLQSLFVPAYKEIFADLPPSLGFLQLLWGSVESLEGISRLSKLEWLMIDRVTKLTSLDGLHGHPTLEMLSLTHCAALKNVSAIAECPNVHSVTFSNCKHVGTSAETLRRTMAARGGVVKIA